MGFVEASCTCVLLEVEAASSEQLCHCAINVGLHRGLIDYVICGWFFVWLAAGAVPRRLRLDRPRSRLPGRRGGSIVKQFITNEPMLPLFIHCGAWRSIKPTYTSVFSNKVCYPAVMATIKLKRK